MSEIKITDLVDQIAIDRIKELDTELKKLLGDYTDIARELAKGLDINVRVVGDLDKLEKLLVDKVREATVVNGKLNEVIASQGQVMANTTNTISRQLMEQERVNKTQREAYADGERFKALLEQVNGSYENRVKRLVETNQAIETNKKQQNDLKKALDMGRISQEQYSATLVKLTMQERSLKQEKADLVNHMKNEEREMQSVDGSYRNMSQRLELMKKAYKDLTDEERESPLGKEMETAIQELDAHLKDTAADMGEFQRNVGNYAIAGRNGVVATESLVAVMTQEARTQQDLIDQTKILEEARLMLNKDDVSYQQTLSALNAKLEENRKRLLDVSDIMGKEAKSVAEAEAQNRRLSEAIKHVDLSSEDAKKKLEEMRAQIARNNSLIAEATGTNEKFADSMLSLLGVNANLGSSLEDLGEGGNCLDGLQTKISAFEKTVMGLVSNPWVLAFLGIAGIAAGFKWWYDFNKGLIEASHLTENFTGATGEAADKVTADMKTMADMMGKSFDQTIGSANTLVQQFGMSWDEAYEKMKDGFVAGADMSGNMLSNIDRFAPALRDAGVSADEFMAILAETRNGIFNEEGIQNIVKAGTRLRSMTKQTEKSLESVGISARQMQKDLEDGNISMIEAVRQIAGKLKELPENSQEAGQVMKNVFGRTAAEGGQLLIQSIADINTNLDKAKDNMGELGRLNEEQMNAQRELNETLMAVFKMSGTSFQEMTTKAKTFIIQGLVVIVRWCGEIANWFVRIYNEAVHVRVCVGAIIGLFKSLWSVAKSVFDLLMNGFGGLGDVLEGIMLVFSGELKAGMDKIQTSLATRFKEIGRTMLNTGKEIGSNFADEFSKAVDKRLEGVSLDLGKGPEGPGSESGIKTVPSSSADSDSEEDKKRQREAEKAAREELKRLQELEASKIAMMADGHEKEMAMIRLNFKKKIDSIKGDGETETALRVQLIAQMTKELEDCETKYQTELSKINLANRLASVKKGSREELDLRLAQLQKSREAELKEAEKTGADVALINAKFDRQRQEMREEYAEKRMTEIQNEYAAEQSARDNAMMGELNALKSRYLEEQKEAKGNAGKLEAINRKFQDDCARIEEKYAEQSAGAAVTMMEEMLQNADLSAEDREKIERDLAAAKMDLETLMADHAISEAERLKLQEEKIMEARKAKIAQWLQVASDALNAVNELAGSFFDRDIERIEKKLEANEEAGEQEQNYISELVNKKVISEEEGEARKRAAEAKTAQNEEELEKKKAAIKHKQALWDKANAVAQAGIATALAVVQAYPNVVMAAIVGALGAMQIATILATPIPKYAKGTDFHKGGPAIVGDGGVPELVVLGNKSWLTPDTPTLVDIPAGASVIPNIELDRNLIPLAYSSAVSDAGPRVVVNNDFRRLEEKMDSFIFLMRRHTAIQRKSLQSRAYEDFKRTKL